MVGPYRLERVLGTGSFATVWLAFDDVLDRKVAVKILADNWSRDNDVRRRFLAEARVLLTVESPRIVRGFHMGETSSGQPYLVMAHADRGTIGDRVDERRREGRIFDARETVGIATEVAYALVDVHASGHLHRDVKPTNVLVRSSPTRRDIAGLAPDETIVLGDFGLARGLDLSALTMVAGSPGYVAPEQAAGLTQLDRRADLYPLGRMMLEMLTGDPGGRATTMASAAAEQVDVVGLLAASPGGLQRPSAALVDLITRLVASNPDDRPESADEVAAALVGIAGASAGRGGAPPPTAPPAGPPVVAGGRPAEAPVPADDDPAGRRSAAWWRRPGAVVAGGLLALAALVAIVVAITRDGGGGSANTTSTAATTIATSSSSTSTRATSTSAGPVVVPESSTAVSAVSVVSATAPSTDSQPGEPARLLLPAGAFSPDLLSSSVPNPDGQEGNMLGGAGAFAAALFEANPEWSGEAPQPNADGTLDFEMTGFDRTARIHVEPAGESAGAEIVGFTIVYT